MLIRNRPMNHEGIQIVDLQILQAPLHSKFNIGPVLVCQFADNMKIFPLNGASLDTGLNSLTDLFFIVIDPCAIDKAVATSDGVFNGLANIFVRHMIRAKSAESDCRDFDAVVEFGGWHILYNFLQTSCPFRNHSLLRSSYSLLRSFLPNRLFLRSVFLGSDGHISIF